jgi:hypothetical protein
MTADGRAHRASVSDRVSPRSDPGQDGKGAVGYAQTINAQRREALRTLIANRIFIRRSDGSFGTSQAEMMTNAMARDLKAKRYAISGFNHQIVPTEKGRKFAEE